ncbi:MAG TPA: extracellular solute-binding protein, partial [Candidatus Omnitrophota bacterium]|nr:extracellular solute-binding protein [Candidatus Omnitrophota bacterium]
NGSWCVNVYDKMNPALQYKVMLPPRVDPDVPMQIWGGAGSSFVVNQTAGNRQRIIDFLKWLTGKEQQVFLSQETKNLPSNREALSEIPDVLLQFAKAMDITTHPSLWPYNESPLVTEAFCKGIQAIIIGEATPEKVATDVQRLKEREMKRERQ